MSSVKGKEISLRLRVIDGCFSCSRTGVVRPIRGIYIGRYFVVSRCVYLSTVFLVGVRYN